MGTIKNRNGMDLTEAADIKKKRQGYTEELYILECEVKQTLGNISTNKSSGSDGTPVELLQILKDDAVKAIYSICQQIWKTQQWPQDWKRSVFIPISKKGNAKECSNYHTIALISHTSNGPQSLGTVVEALGSSSCCLICSTVL